MEFLPQDAVVRVRGGKLAVEAKPWLTAGWIEHRRGQVRDTYRLKRICENELVLEREIVNGEVPR